MTGVFRRGQSTLYIGFDIPKVGGPRNLPLNKIVGAVEPVNPYENLTAASCLRTEASRRKHGKGDTGRIRPVDPSQANCGLGIPAKQNRRDRGARESVRQSHSRLLPPHGGLTEAARKGGYGQYATQVRKFSAHARNRREKRGIWSYIVWLSLI